MLGGNPTSASPADTSMLYAGEQFDTSLQMYYNRARYYDQNIGRFNRMDPYAGNTQDPQSLHKYLYCHANPVNGTDPSGESFLTGTLSVSMVVGIAIAALVPAYIAAYQTALAGGTWLQIAKNAGIAWAKWMGIGLSIVLFLPFVAAAAAKLLVIFGLSKAAATLVVTLCILGLMTTLLAKGMYNIWTSDLPVRVKIGITGLVALSLACMIGKGGIKKLLSNAKTIIKKPSEIGKIMKGTPYKPTQGQKAIDINKVNQYADAMKSGNWKWDAMSDPIITDSKGAIMSGHHRIIAATIAGVKIPESAIVIYPAATARPIYDWDGNIMPN